MRTHRVAVLGAGPAAQAIHLPALASLGSAVRVTEVMDVDHSLAGQVAGLHGARVSHDLDGLLAGDGFEIAVIGTPDRFHADQVEALCSAGVRAILVEKPLATTAAEIERVRAAVTASSTAVVVGAMHTYDPAWLEARAAFTPVGRCHARSVIYIPANAHFEDMATTMIRPDPRAGADADAAQRIRGGILGLAIHNLPLVRRFLPELDTVGFAATLDPWGYTVTASGPGGTLELLARTGGTWRPDWTLTVWDDQSELQLAFPPSYVAAGSATATLRDRCGTRDFGPHPQNGYAAEWRELLRILDGKEPAYDLGRVVTDLEYAMALADLTVAALEASAA